MEAYSNIKFEYTDSKHNKHLFKLEMTKENLTKTQRSVLSRMKSGVEYCSFDLGCSIRTMRVLERKGFVTSYVGVRGCRIPSINIKWKLK